MAHIEFFKKSGKPAIAYMQSGGEKEYALAAACGEIYVPPTAQLALRGLAVEGQFLRGVLDKVGVKPQVCLLIRVRATLTSAGRHTALFW